MCFNPVRRNMIRVNTEKHVKKCLRFVKKQAHGLESKILDSRPFAYCWLKRTPWSKGPHVFLAKSERAEC